jgi:hypothetical protein
MRTQYKTTLFLAVGALCMSIVAPLRAATIFDNSLNDLSVRFNPGTKEVGDEIILAGTERYLTGFSFEYWGTNTANPTTFAGAVQAQVKFYRNNGTPFNGYPTPDNAFYDSGLFSLDSLTTARRTEVFTVADFPGGVPLFIPTSHMTWSVQFSGMGGTDTVGVDIYSPPTVGSDYPDYWQNNGTTFSPSWVLLTNTVPMDFAARFTAIIPEPSAVTLSIMGGLGLLTLARRLRRKE